VFVTRGRVRAFHVNAKVTFSMADDVDIAWSARVEAAPNTASSVVLGPGVRLGQDVLLSLRGGSIEIGAETDVRRSVSANATGALRIGRDVVLSWGVVLHCAEAVTIDDHTIVGEYSTIADSSHRRTPPGVPIHHTVRSAPVRIGSNVWIGAKATVIPGVTVGDQAMIGAGAVVTHDVPTGWLAAGVPARAIRELTVDG
jgi:acetyltransferase-like isoleucine patch superfamily enzyme